MNASTSLPLQTLGDSGKAPARRVASAADAQTIVQTLVWSNRERARFAAKIKGMLDGNAPYDAAKLKANAQSYRANVNFMEGESALSAALVPYYDLFAGSKNYCEVKLYHENPDEQENKSGVVTEEFDCLLKKYAGFEFQMNGVLHDFVAFGKGFVMFPKEWGWHFQRVSFNRVFVPDGQEASVEKVEIAVIRESMQLHTLWNYIKDRETATKAGWDTGAVADAIREAMPENRETQTNQTLSYDYVQQRMRDRDLVEGTKPPTVPVAHLLVKEFDGSVTHMMVEETRGAANPRGPTAPPVPFLFNKAKKFNNMREVLCAFFFETLDGSWNGARGLGHKVYASMEIKNRLLCKIVDNAFLSGGITLQATDANSLQKTNLVQAGDFNIIPPGYLVQNAQIFVNSQGLGATNQLLDQTISSNTGIFKAKMEKPAGNPRTAKEVEIQYQNATVLSNSGVSRFYGQMDPFYFELYRRVTHKTPLDNDESEEAKAVREFIKRCKRRGVTIEEMRKVESVRASRNIGNGSQAQRTQALERFEPFLPLLPESGKQNWLEMVVASEFGQSMVERLVPPRDKQLMPSDEQAWALLENAAMKAGAPVAWTPKQNNLIHATEHLKAMAGGLASLQEGGQPMEVLGFLEAAGPHVQLHLDHMAGDGSRRAEWKTLTAQFQQIAQVTDQLSDKIQEGQEAEQQAQQEQAAAQAKAQAIANGTDPGIAIKQAQAAMDMQLKQAKAAQALQLKDAAARQKLAVTDLKLAQSLKHQAAKASEPKGE
jgi:hypothetical protein